MSASRPSPGARDLRPLAAAAAAGAVVAVAPRAGGPLGLYALSLPILAGAGGWLVRRRFGGGGTARAALLVLLLSPAAAVHAWQADLAAMGLAWVEPVSAVYEALVAAGRSTTGAAGLLLAAAAAMAILEGRGVVLAAVAAAVAALAGWSARASAEALMDGAWTRASALATLAGGAWPITGMAGAWAATREPGRVARLLLVLATVAAAWTARAPVGELLEMLPRPVATPELPAAAPGLAPALPALPAGGLDAALAARGLPLEPDEPWTCAIAETDAWLRRPRATAVLALPADTRLPALDALVDTAWRRLVSRLVLLGRATPPRGVLGPWLAVPGLPIVTEAPPRAPAIAILGGSPTWIDAAGAEVAPPAPGGRAACVVLPTDGLTVGELWRVGRELAGPGSTRRCAALVLPPRDHRPTGYDAAAIRAKLAGLELPCR